VNHVSAALEKVACGQALSYIVPGPGYPTVSPIQGTMQ